MHALDAPSSRSPRVVSTLAAVFALAAACGDSGNTSTEGGTTTAETTGTTAATTEAPTTTTGTDTAATTTTGSSTTGDPAVCDGSMPANAFECQACTECGTWTTPLPGGSYPPAVVCMLEGMRDDVVVGAQSETCDQGKCQIARMLTTGMGTMLSQQMLLDQNTQMMEYFSIQELPFKEASYFEACLAAYDENCASPNSWFTGASVDVTSLVCP